MRDVSARWDQRRVVAVLVVAALLLVPGAGAWAEAVVTIAHNEPKASLATFRFGNVAAPRYGAAVGASFTLVDGERDPNGATLDALHDGRLPAQEDQPEGNFFFAPHTNGGRILVDLGKVLRVREIDTYSWHTGGRAPQVYQVYGSDGKVPGFVANVKRPQDPGNCGWKAIATVDTRPGAGDPGGQYAASILDPAGPALGAYRYLLFDVAAADKDDVFGNTFYSEIVVLDGDAPVNSRSDTLLPTARQEIAIYQENGYKLIWAADDPTFDPGERERLVRTFFAVYPKLAAAFNKDAPREVRISVETRYHGVAATANETIHVNPDWFRRHPADLDVVTHESMHVVQHYRQWEPVWLVEGIADYARYKFGVDNPGGGWTLPEYRPSQHYDDSYRVTARFLAALEKNTWPGIVKALDQSLRAGQYTPATWQQITGKSVEELWREYAKNPTL